MAKKMMPVKVLADPTMLPPTPRIFTDKKHSIKPSNSNDYSPMDLFQMKDSIEVLGVTELMERHGGQSDFTSQKQSLNFDMYKVPHKKQFVAHLKHPCQLFFHGKLQVKIIVGSVEVLGFNFEPSSRFQSIDIFSTNVTSALYIQTKSSMESMLDRARLQDALLMEGVLATKDIKTVMNRLCEMDVLLVIEELHCDFPIILEKYFGKSTFPQSPVRSLISPEASKTLNCLFWEDPGKASGMKKAKEWDNIPLKKCNVICGGNGVGKSTFLKYCINSSLSEFQSILCLDFDPGQPEFTPPGFISAVMVSKPLLGANFSHLIQPDRTVFLGDVNVAQCPSLYLECVQHIINYCASNTAYAKIPWFVNTMGFSKGLGVSLMMSILNMLRPDTVVQITSRDQGRNYPFLFTPEALKFCDSASTTAPLHYTFHAVQSAAESQEDGKALKSSLKPRESREIMLLSYLSSMMPSPYFNLNACQPYSIPFCKLYLLASLPISPQDMMRAFNGSMVALCHFEESDGRVVAPHSPDYFRVVIHSKVIPSYGLGFVRGIDCEKKKLFLVTHLAAATLESVNCLMIGTIAPPQSIFLNQITVDGSVPYTTLANENANTQHVRRPFKNPPNRSR